MAGREEPKSGLTRSEKHIIYEIRKINFGSLTIQVKNGEPYRIEEKTESIMLGSVDVADDDLIP